MTDAAVTREDASRCNYNSLPKITAKVLTAAEQSIFLSKPPLPRLGDLPIVLSPYLAPDAILVVCGRDAYRRITTTPVVKVSMLSKECCCDASDTCPLGKVGTEQKCNEKELRAGGIKIVEVP